MWQAILGSMFLITFLLWAWFAFIHPPIFGKHNDQRYHDALYQAIFKGSPVELAAIAEEFARSARSLIRLAPEIRHTQRTAAIGDNSSSPTTFSREVNYAHDTLLLIADKRFCRAIVEYSPGTALTLFRELEEARKYRVPISIFSSNFLNESLKNKNSVFFQETEGYETGLIGFHKPLSHTIFANYRMVEAIGTLLDPDHENISQWNSTHWRVYCRLVLITLRAYVEEENWTHSVVLYRAQGVIASATDDLRYISGLNYGKYDSDILDRVAAVVNFIKRAVDILEDKGIPEKVQLRLQDLGTHRATIYDQLARTILTVIRNASTVQSPRGLCWAVQYNLLWGRLFGAHELRGRAGRVIKYKVRRLIYEEILNVKRFADIRGAKILGLCLNVMGLTVPREHVNRETIALHTVVLSWTKKNFVWLHSNYPQVARECLVEHMNYDENSKRLFKANRATPMVPDPVVTYLQLVAEHDSEN